MADDITKLSDDELRRQAALQSMSDEELKALTAQSKAEKRSPLQMVGHYAGLVGRGAIRGAVGAAEQFIPPIYPPGSVGRKAIEAIDPAVEKRMTEAGLPQPEGFGERALTGVSEFLPALIGRPGIPLSKIRQAELNAARTANQVADETIAAGRKEGLVTYPDTGAGKAALMLGGKTPMRETIRDRNLPQYDRMSREEAGLKPGERIEPETLKAARARIAEPYNELGKMAPAAAKLWKEVQDLRVQAKRAWNSAQTNVEKDAARSLDQQALDKEEEIDKIAQLNFKPNQLQKLREARVKLAKNYQVDEAVIEGTGHVDPRVYQRAVNDRRPMTGKLEMMGKFKNAEQFSLDKMKEESGMLHGAIGASVHHGGGGLYYPGLPFIGKLARNYALSEVGQVPPSYRSGIGIRLSDIAMRGIRDPGALLIPGIGLRSKKEEPPIVDGDKAIGAR